MATSDFRELFVIVETGDDSRSRFTQAQQSHRYTDNLCTNAHTGELFYRFGS